jgi:hypothetical protein
MGGGLGFTVAKSHYRGSSFYTSGLLHIFDLEASASLESHTCATSAFGSKAASTHHCGCARGCPFPFQTNVGAIPHPTTASDCPLAEQRAAGARTCLLLRSRCTAVPAPGALQLREPLLRTKRWAQTYEEAEAALSQFPAPTRARILANYQRQVTNIQSTEARLNLGLSGVSEAERRMFTGAHALASRFIKTDVVPPFVLVQGGCWKSRSQPILPSPSPTQV